MPLTIKFADSSTADIKTAHWDFGDKQSKDLSTADASTSHTYTQAASNLIVKMSVEFLNGCLDSDTQQVSITEVPVADYIFDPLPASSNDPRINFSNKSSQAALTPLSYVWHFGSTAQPDSSTTKDPWGVWFDAPNGDTLDVTLISRNSLCADTITKTVYIKGAFSLFVPSAFSPNGDGLNDLFYPGGRYHACETCRNYEFVVFDRWGEIIFRSTKVDEGWNGRRNNVMGEAQIDVYVWKLTYTDSFTGKPGEEMGKVTLVR